MRCACIDIGSNTTRLLVADRLDAGGHRRLVPVRNDRAFTRIGAATGPDGRISADKLAEVAEVVGGLVESARALGVDRIRCVATAAIRHASNGPELVRLVQATCDGVVVEVLTGEDEARFAFLGAVGSAEAPFTASVGVVDVGGGSSELVVGDPPGRIRWWRSLELGSGALTRETELSDPPGPSELARARDRVASRLSDVRPPAATTVLAVGGSATSLRLLVGEILDAAACRSALERLVETPSAQLAPSLGLDPDRVRLLPAGLLILDAIADRFGVPLTVGRGGLREGVLLDLAR